MAVTKWSSRKWVNILSDGANNWNSVNHPVQIVLPSFYALRFVSDERYLHADAASEVEHLQVARN